MNELFSKIQPKLDENRNWDYSNYMTEHFPRRISGMGDDRRASEWIVDPGEQAVLPYFLYAAGGS